ncbi:MAG: hypothetical protein WC460_02610 [Patescibacteria group bacterium]
MEKPNLPERKEQFEKLDLKIIPPQLDKNYMIAYDCKTKLQCQAYRYAVNKVLEDAHLKPFHQVGESPDSVGYHAFECWKADKDPAFAHKISSLIDKIHDIAKEEFLFYRDF